MGEGGVQKIKIKPEKPFYTKGPISCELRPNKYKVFSTCPNNGEYVVTTFINIFIIWKKQDGIPPPHTETRDEMSRETTILAAP